MAQANKKSLSYKLQKNPFLFVFIIVIAAVVLFAVINITDSIGEKNRSKLEENTTDFVQTTAEPVAEQKADNSVELSDLKKYDTSIVSVTAEKTADKVTVKAVYSNKTSLLKSHYADNVNNSQVVPVFCFYTADGVQLKCPGELELIEGNSTAVYTLTVIDDYKNAVAVSDEITIDFENILDNGFNVYLQHKTEKGVGATALGTYKKSVEDYNETAADICSVSNTAAGIKNVEITSHDKFIWIDIYYDDASSYSSLNHDFETNFVCFEFEKNGEKHKRDFIVTQYDDLNMLRCKFDEYSLNELADETGDTDKTVSDIFSDYTVSVLSRDYETETSLFTLS